MTSSDIDDGPGPADRKLIEKYQKVFTKYPREFAGPGGVGKPDWGQQVMFARMVETGKIDVKDWARGVKYRNKLADFKEEQKNAKTDRDRILALLKAKRLQASQVAKYGKSFGTAMVDMLAEPLPVVGDKNKREEKETEKALKEKASTHEGGWIVDYEAGIAKSDEKILGTTVWVINTGKKFSEMNAVRGQKTVGHKTADVTCYEVIERGFFVIKEEGQLKGWLDKNADAYLVRPMPGKVSDTGKATEEKFEARQANFDPGRSPKQRAARAKAKSEEEGAEDTGGGVRFATDEVTGQPMIYGEPGDTNICVEYGTFKALLSAESQFEVISMGQAYLQVIQAVFGAVAGNFISALNPGAVPGLVEFMKSGTDIAEPVLEYLGENMKFWTPSSLLNSKGKVLFNKELAKKSEPFAQLAFTWSGGAISDDLKGDQIVPLTRVKCTDVLTIEGVPFAGVRIAELSKAAKIP